MRWNGLRGQMERFGACHLYSIALTGGLAVVNPVAIVYVLDYLQMFDPVSLLTYVSLSEYFIAHLTGLAIMCAQNGMGGRTNKLLALYNEAAQFYQLATRSGLEGGWIGRRIGRMNAAMVVLSSASIMVNVFCLNFLKPIRAPLPIIVCSCIGSFPAPVMAVFSLLFGGAMQVIGENFRQINRDLCRVMQEVKEMGQTTARHCVRIQRYCDLADAIDRLAGQHKSLAEYTLRFSGYYAIPMLFVVLNAFFSVVAQAFFFYMNVALLIRGRTGNDMDGSLKISRICFICSQPQVSAFGLEAKFMRTFN